MKQAMAHQHRRTYNRAPEYCTCNIHMFGLPFPSGAVSYQILVQTLFPVFLPISSTQRSSEDILTHIATEFRETRATGQATATKRLSHQVETGLSNLSK